jgi:hypothetical protein
MSGHGGVETRPMFIKVVESHIGCAVSSVSGVTQGNSKPSIGIIEDVGDLFANSYIGSLTPQLPNRLSWLVGSASEPTLYCREREKRARRYIPSGSVILICPCRLHNITRHTGRDIALSSPSGPSDLAHHRDWHWPAHAPRNANPVIWPWPRRTKCPRVCYI